MLSLAPPAVRRWVRAGLLPCLLLVAVPLRAGGPLGAPAERRTYRDVEYVAGGGKLRSFDLEVPAGATGPFPLVVWIHGGSWRGGDKGKNPAAFLGAYGLATASINYRLLPAAPFPAQLQDCKAAIRFLRAVNTGHPGSISTIHANSCAGAIEQVALLALQARVNLGRAEIIAYARSVIDIVVQLRRDAEGRRVLAEVQVSDHSGI